MDIDDIENYSSDEDERGPRKVLHIDTKGQHRSVDAARLASPVKTKKSVSKPPQKPAPSEPRNLPAEVIFQHHKSRPPPCISDESRAALKNIAKQHSTAANSMMDAGSSSSAKLSSSVSCLKSTSSSIADVTMASTSSRKETINDVLMRNSKALSQSSQQTPEKLPAKKDNASSTGAAAQEATQSLKPGKGQKSISNFFHKAPAISRK
jgi:hypothetical protein